MLKGAEYGGPLGSFQLHQWCDLLFVSLADNDLASVPNLAATSLEDSARCFLASSDDFRMIGILEYLKMLLLTYLYWIDCLCFDLSDYEL